jgi:hypothetical protein
VKGSNANREFNQNGMLHYIWYQGRNFEYSGKYIGIATELYQSKWRKVEQNNYYTPRATMEWNSKGTYYVGQAKSHDKSNLRNFLPHGNGKWTFPDGTILEGDGVAYKGQPRHIIQKIEH